MADITDKDMAESFEAIRMIKTIHRIQQFLANSKGKWVQDNASFVKIKSTLLSPRQPWVHQKSSSNSSISYTTDQNIWKVWGGDCNRVPANDHDLHKHKESERSNSRIFSQPWKNGGREQDCNAQHTHCKHSSTAHAAHMTHHLYAYNECNNLLQKITKQFGHLVPSGVQT